MIVIKYFTLGAFYHLCASLWEVSDVKPRMYQWAFDRDTLTKFRNMHLEETGSQGIIYHILDHDIRTSLQVSRSRYVDIFG